ncbi:MAG: hypothetical protein ABS69_03785 [Nitrosomonadales bacterium SCN 54-20]|nr:MAG: hypothetical protein ABS69_03785 [Nitrosomonadales bacterium SCN 54-20]
MLRAVTRIKLCILELQVIFIILSPVGNGFQRLGLPLFAEACRQRPSLRHITLHLPLQHFSLKSVRQEVYEPIGLSTVAKCCNFRQRQILKLGHELGELSTDLPTGARGDLKGISSEPRRVNFNKFRRFAGGERVFSSQEDALYRENMCHGTFGTEDRKSGGIE